MSSLFPQHPKPAPARSLLSRSKDERGPSTCASSWLAGRGVRHQSQPLASPRGLYDDRSQDSRRSRKSRPSDWLPALCPLLFFVLSLMRNDIFIAKGAIMRHAGGRQAEPFSAASRAPGRGQSSRSKKKKTQRGKEKKPIRCPIRYRKSDGGLASGVTKVVRYHAEQYRRR